MCCQETETLDLPAEVIETLARYRKLLDDRGWDWGDEQIDVARWARFSQYGPLNDAFMATGDWAKAIRSVIGSDVPAGIVVIHVDANRSLRAEIGPARPAIVGRDTQIDVVVDSAAESDMVLTVAGRDLAIRPRGAAVETIHVDGANGAFTVTLDGTTLDVEGAIRTSGAAKLRLSSPHCARWSVTDASGGAWFPDDVLAKWDVLHRPFFHGHDVTLVVPAESLHVVCARGLEFDRTEIDVLPSADNVLVVECDPQHVFDPSAEGWYGGDLHIHMNYSGDLVCTPRDVARMQLGEGLHLANVMAANGATSFVYDREMLEQFADTDLPWSTDGAVARMGVEYRNDLLGHVHALGPSGPPARYYAGQQRSDHPEDWPPNSVACEELRGLGAAVGYAHPAMQAFPDDGSTNAFFQNPRSVEARELVADAALGLVDSVELISPFNHEGAIFLYHRLLSCGLRLAATAGTDTFLSFSHFGVISNPPGWARVYAQLGDQALSVPAFKDAIRAGRTFVTNGPWLTLSVNGRGPGAVLELSPDDHLDIRAHVRGPGAEHLTLIGPDGVMAEGDASTQLHFETTLRDGPLWIAAVARGSGHPNTLDRSVLAHTSPVYIDIAGQRVARAAAAQWCLDFLNTLEQFVDAHGHFDAATRTAHFGDFVAVLDRARRFYRRVAESARR